MEITRIAGGDLFLSQSLYVKDVLKRFVEHIGAKTTKFNESITTKSNFIRGVPSILNLRKIQSS